MLKHLHNTFLLTRPYSWISILFVGLIANIIANKILVYNINFFFDLIISMSVWFSGNFISELMHRGVDKRKPISNIFPLSFIIFLIFIVLYRNVFSVLFLIVIFISIIIYASKNKNWYSSKFSFLSRGIVEFSLFFLILSFYLNDILQFINFALIFYFVTISRNLIGDIRDVEFDKYSFPKKIGIRSSYILSILFGFITIYIIGNILIAFPLIIFILYVFFNRNAYFIHRLFVVVSMFLFLNIIFSLLSYTLILSNLIFIGVLLNFTYTKVPRKSNPEINYFTG